jgi:hypothetical protein
MKKVLFLALGLSVGMTVMAQTKVISKKPEQKELRQDIREKDAHKKAAVKNLTKLKIKKAGKEQDKVNAKRKEIHTETKELRAVGDKHPTQHAKKVIRKQKAIQKARENS